MPKLIGYERGKLAFFTSTYLVLCRKRMLHISQGNTNINLDSTWLTCRGHSASVNSSNSINLIQKNTWKFLLGSVLLYNRDSDIFVGMSQSITFFSISLFLLVIINLIFNWAQFRLKIPGFLKYCQEFPVNYMQKCHVTLS